MKSFYALTLVAFVMVTSFFSVAQAKDARKSPHETIKNGNISVTYGRPMKHGRDIFGALVPFGEVWRTGADEATEITFKKDAMVNGNPIKAGTYTLFTVPQKDRWEIIFNSKLKQWGAYDYNKTNDILRTQAQVKELSAPVEQFTIKVTNDGLQMEWDKTSITVPMK